jgi:hypothetical protein
MRPRFGGRLVRSCSRYGVSARAGHGNDFEAALSVLRILLRCPSQSHTQPPPEPDIPVAYGITANGPTTDLFMFGPRRRDVVKAPPPPVIPMFNWSGFYIGGNAGWGRSDDCLSARSIESARTGIWSPCDSTTASVTIAAQWSPVIQTVFRKSKL